MIAWTIYVTFAGAVLALVLPRAWARWIALLATSGGFSLALLAFFRTPIVDLAKFTTITRTVWVPALGM
jgi:hypothetical protein